MINRDYINGKIREKRRSLAQLRIILSTHVEKLNVPTPEGHTAYKIIWGRMCALRRDIRCLEALRDEI